MIPIEDFEKIHKNIGGLLSISNFLSTSQDQNVAEVYAANSRNELNQASVIFEINVDQSIRNTAHFADIQSLSNIHDESEYLFTMGSVFRIVSVTKSSTNDVWLVKLELTNDNDPDLVCLTYSIRSLVISEKMSHTHTISLALLLMIVDESELGI